MLSVAFVVAALLLSLELRRKQMDVGLVGPTTILALLFGGLGSRLFAAMEDPQQFLRAPLTALLSGPGLAYLGGFLCATLAIIAFLWLKGVPLLRFCDATTPGLMIAYGIARIGCQLSGDGDYGHPTDLPWAMGYPRGTVPTLAAENPELVGQFRQLFPGRPVPEDILVHPAPVYETLVSILLFAVLWRLRRRPASGGWLFFVYLVLSGLARLAVEFVRLNPRWLIGLSQAQLISLALIALGVVGLASRRGAQSLRTAALR
jgi:phosphatidylglycerol:prolipoprotein diacylglycerol transferase